jgi:hypothetical protein
MAFFRTRIRRILACTPRFAGIAISTQMTVDGRAGRPVYI